MTTITTLVETLNTTIGEANDDIKHLEQCNECLASQIEENRHLISWNRGVMDHAEFTLDETEKGQKTAIHEAPPPYTKDDIIVSSKCIPQLRERLTLLMHNRWKEWADAAGVTGFKSFHERDELEYKEADAILGVIRGDINER